ncbi:MAG: PAS domain S-box protein [Pseudodesulfovibrio sp.]|nr:PAS domain S-box protein [Pseudodesulfovibrio sp.]
MSIARLNPIHTRALQSSACLSMMLVPSVAEATKQSAPLTIFQFELHHAADFFAKTDFMEPNIPLIKLLHTPEQQWLDCWTPHLVVLGAITLIIALALYLFNRKFKKGIAARTHMLEHNSKSLRQVLDLVPNRVYAKNREGKILLVNRAMAESLGSTVTDLKDQNHMDVCQDKEQAEQIHADDQIVFDTGFPKVTLEEPCKYANGSIHWLQTTRLPYTSVDTNEPAVLILSVDITNRRLADKALKKSEEKLRRLNEELEERVLERTRNLEEAKTELEKSLEQLRRTQKELILSEKMAALGGLVAGVAHEINTPLGIGVTASSFLEEKLIELNRKFVNDELKKSDLEHFIHTGLESSGNILTNLNRAAELIKSFKQVAADQSSEMARKFNLKIYVDEILLSLRPKYKRTGHTVLNDCPDYEIYSYPGAFIQIITNLLINSLTHAFEGNDKGIIRIGASVQDNELQFTFSDNGIGIPKELTDKVFEPFFTTKRSTGGTGLGLHIVFNTVTQTLGGTIRLDSMPGKGTSYTISMPLRKQEPEQA